MNNQAQQDLEMSLGQKALWYLNQLEPDSTAYHLGLCLQLAGSLDKPALVSAWSDVGAAHPQLRARFVLRNEGGPSVVIDPLSSPLGVETGGVGEIDRFWSEIAGRPFSLGAESPVRSLLLRDTNGPSHLLLCLHHIAGDFWSAAIILQELSACYAARASGMAPLILGERMKYDEFARAECRWLDGPEGFAAWKFWRQYLDGVKTEPILTRCVADEKPGEVPVTFGTAETAIIRRAARNLGTTPYAILMACYARLLAEETGRDELIIGTPATVRDHASLRTTVGYLVNAVPVRCPVVKGGEHSIAATMANIRDALKHRHFPLPVLVERMQSPRPAGATPLFQSMFAYHSLPRVIRGVLPAAIGGRAGTWEFGGGITAKTVAMRPFDAQFPLALTLGWDGEGFSGYLQYDGRRVTVANATRLAGRFLELAGQVPARRNTTPAGLALDGSVARLEHLFDSAAGRTPNAIAASERGMDLTYAQVKAHAEALAASLDAALPGNARPVAVQMPSCAEAAIILLAILKSGRAFQTVDPGEPLARRNAALLRTGACALLTSVGIDCGALPDGVAALDPEKLRVFSSPPVPVTKPSGTAYLVFTSGSTGEPKAVEVEHAAILNHARAAVRLFGLTGHDRVLQFHTLAFDAAFEEIFPTWAAGGCVVFEPEARRYNVPALLEVTASTGVTVLNLPTSYWHTMTEEAVRLAVRLASSVRLMVVGGERASEKAYAAWCGLAPHCRWINTYGPTEATITALSFEPPTGAAVRGVLPIGRPIDGVTALLLNAESEPISVGEGELLIGGAGLALGYRGDPEATAAKFVTCTINGKAQRLYRSGDRVRLRRDGNFEYLGRFDRQLKIRGFRVDPEEIERALLAHSRIAEAVVIPRKINGEWTLAAWVVRTGASVTEDSLRAHLAAQLPKHLIPSQLTLAARLPRKPSGKLDRSVLVRARSPQTACGDRGPREMAALFSEVLRRKVGVNDDFFRAGGHSLLAIKLLGRVEARYGARISASEFVVAPTPKHLWARLPETRRQAAVAVPESSPAETPVSGQQRRALLAHETEHPSIANIVLLLRSDAPIDGPSLKRAVEAVAQRHPLLRCGFFRTHKGVVLRETEEIPTLEQRTLPGRDFQRAAVHLARQEGMIPFALESATPWLRLLLVSSRAGSNCHLILITHHAVADGWALELMLDDLRVAYDRNRVGIASLKPAGDYRDYALLQAEWLNDPAAREQAAFWKTHLAGAEEALLPFRRAPSPGAPWQLERHALTLSRRLSGEFRRLAVSCGTTPFVLAMAAFKALIHRYAGQRDVLLATMISNRSAGADQAIFGPLQNPVLIRDEITSNLSLRTLARKVARSVAEAQDKGTLPFEQVMREAFAAREVAALDRSIQFLSHSRATRALRLGRARLYPVELPPEESPFELSIAVSADTTQIQIVFDYRSSAFSAAAIEHLAQQYATLLQASVAAPDAAIGELNIIFSDELRALNDRASAIHRPRRELLHHGFEVQARRNPDALAIAARGRRLTYGELHSISEAVAGELAARGLKAGNLVAVMLPKGWEQVVACLAVLKAGGVYVPIDPALPEARFDAIFDQGGFHAAIVADATLPSARYKRALRLLVAIPSHAKPLAAPVRADTNPDSLAYVIFTSGSTGVPKGVMVSHQAAMTTVAEVSRRFQLCASDRVLAVSSLGFDLSVFDIFGTLRAGGTIVMPGHSDPKEWLEQVVTERVTVWNSVPCLFELLLDEVAARGTRLDTLRLIMLSGDMIAPALARRARTALPRSRLISLGGATEGAIWSIAHEIKEVDPSSGRVPYGRALRGQEVFVLDRALDHCPTGVTGELFIAGATLAKGYWRNASETRRRFLVHPRWKIRLYRTGDRGRYLDDGEIEILGRLDEQVKVNGVRLELGEVEMALCSLPAVRQALVEVRADSAGNNLLIAFVAAECGTSASTLSAHARKALPAALRPAAYVVVEHFPLTANGKVDRSALRAMTLSSAANTAATPAANPVERWIAELWSSLLGGGVVGVEDDFFALGGHSLLAIRMLQRVRSRFAVDLPLQLILERPTVRGLATAVSAAVLLPPKAGLPRRATAEFEHDLELAISGPVSRPTWEPAAVLLTGATGRLGSALLVELLKQTNDRVYCLVRASSNPEAAARVLKALEPRAIPALPVDRIVGIAADLGRERFGLDRAAFAALAAGIRAAYHCAAEVNFIAPYENLAATNVAGAREMIRLTAAGGAVLHHVSSVAVFPYGGRRIRHEDEDIAAIEWLTGGYAQSKWVSERLVWQAISRGLRAVIYRPAQIVGPATGGSPSDLFEHVLLTCKILQSIPDLETKLDMVTAEYAASAIRHLSAQESSVGKAFHLVHPEPVSLRDFVGLLPAPLPLVPLDAWLERLAREAGRGDDPSLHLILMLAQGLGRDEVTPPGFDCSGTTASLLGTGISCPPLDRLFIEKVMTNGVNNVAVTSKNAPAQLFRSR